MSLGVLIGGNIADYAITISAALQCIMFCKGKIRSARARVNLTIRNTVKKHLLWIRIPMERGAELMGSNSSIFDIFLAFSDRIVIDEI